MVDLKKLSPAALSAAMRGGTDAWGSWASSNEHVRYAEPIPKEYWRRRRKCRCGCGKKATHNGKANGIALTDGCELSMARWVRTGEFRSALSHPKED